MINSTGNTLLVEIEELNINAVINTFICDYEDLFDHDNLYSHLIVYPICYDSPSILYEAFFDHIKSIKHCTWINKEYSHCIKITETSETNYTFCLGEDICTECNIYNSLLIAMVSSLDSSKNCCSTVYGVLILQDMKIKVYKLNRLTQLMVYQINISDVRVSEILEYIVNYTCKIVQRSPVENLVN
jgi:hypothetical protein